jgi:hypothetical protein
MKEEIFPRLTADEEKSLVYSIHFGSEEANRSVKTIGKRVAVYMKALLVDP